MIHFYLCSNYSELRAPEEATPGISSLSGANCSAFDFLEEVAPVDGFGYECIHPGFEAFCLGFFESVGRQRNDGTGGAMLAPADLSHGFVAIHYRHVAIHDDEIVLTLLVELVTECPIASSMLMTKRRLVGLSSANKMRSFLGAGLTGHGRSAADAVP
jgi:hypothetical protein